MAYDNWTFDNVTGRVDVDTSKEMVRARVGNAVLCGFKANALYMKRGEYTYLNIASTGNNTFENVFSCVLNKKEKIASGVFSYKAHLEAKGKGDDLLKHLYGGIIISSEKGRIYKMAILFKILQFISISNIATLNIHQFFQRGVNYKRFYGKASIVKGKLHIINSYIECDGVKIVATGDIKLYNSKVKLLVLAAPFATAGKIISKIPIIGYILTGKSKTLISIPMKITGTLEKPNIIPMSPTAIGSGVFGVLKRTLTAPVRILENGMKAPAQK